MNELERPPLQLANDDEKIGGKKNKRLTPEDDYRQRMIVQYKLDPNIKPEDLEKEISNIERKRMVAECVAFDPECGLNPDSTWEEINAFNRAKAHKAWAIENGLPPETSREEVDAHIAEKHRLELARELGKPLDTPWHELTLIRMKEEESRLVLEGERMATGKSKKKSAR